MVPGQAAVEDLPDREVLAPEPIRLHGVETQAMAEGDPCQPCALDRNVLQEPLALAHATAVSPVGQPAAEHAKTEELLLGWFIEQSSDLRVAHAGRAVAFQHVHQVPILRALSMRREKVVARIEEDSVTERDLRDQ